MFYELLSMPESNLIAAGLEVEDGRISAKTTIKSGVYLFPPLPEQERIAAYLDASCAAIDAAVAAKRGQLETLDALRKTTITASGARWG